MVFQGYVVTTSYSRRQHKFCKGRKESQNVNAPKMLLPPCFQQNPVDLLNEGRRSRGKMDDVEVCGE